MTISSVYMIIDCRTDSAPFSALKLHEVMHHWAHGARELASLSIGEYVDLGLVLVRRQSFEQALPWGRHQRSTVFQCIQRLQAAWVSDCDTDADAGKSVPTGECVMLHALQGAERVLSQGAAVGTKTEGFDKNRPTLEAWSLCPEKTFEAIENIFGKCASKLSAYGVNTSIVAVGCDVDPAGIIPKLGAEVVKIKPTRSGVLRHMRRHIGMQLNAHVYLPINSDVMSGMRAMGQACEGLTLQPVKCMCISSLLLFPESESAAVQSWTIEFRFSHMAAHDLHPPHTYGVPLLVHEQGTRCSGYSVSKLRDRIEVKSATFTATIDSFVHNLTRRPGCAVFTAKLCPRDLRISSETNYFAALPGGNHSLVLRGLVTDDLLAAAAPSLSMSSQEGEQAKMSLTRNFVLDGPKSLLAFEHWNREPVFNPLSHLATPSYVEVFAESAAMDASRALAQQQADLGMHKKGRGRGRAKGRSRNGQVQPDTANFTPARDGFHGGDIHQTPMLAYGCVPAAGTSLASLTPLLEQSKKRRVAAQTAENAESCATSAASDVRRAPIGVPVVLGPLGKEVEKPHSTGTVEGAVTKGDVESIFAGQFNFQF